MSFSGPYYKVKPVNVLGYFLIFHNDGMSVSDDVYRRKLHIGIPVVDTELVDVSSCNVSSTSDRSKVIRYFVFGSIFPLHDPKLVALWTSNRST